MESAPSRRLQYLCNVPGCGRAFAQRQGVTRHQREAHAELGFGTNRRCGRCGEPWARPYMFKEHLKKMHPDVDADAELEKVKDSENSRNHLPQARISPPILEHDRRNRAESQVHPQTPPLPATAMTKPPLVSPPAFLQVDYDLQSESAELTITGSEREDARQSEALNPTRAGTPPFTEERPQMVKDLDAYNHTLILLPHGFAFTTLVISDVNHSLKHTNSQDGRTAVDPSSNLVTRSALMVARPVSEHHGNPVPVTPMAAPLARPGTTYSSLAHTLDDGIQTNGPAKSSLSGGPYANINFS
jgi:hypothetical protein